MVNQENIKSSQMELSLSVIIVDSSRKIDAGPHIHDEIEMIYIMEGYMNFFFGDQKIRVDKGKTIIVNSLIVHSSESVRGVYTKYCKIQFCPGVVYDIKMSEYKYLTPFINHNAFSYRLLDGHANEGDQYFSNLMVSVANEYYEKKVAYELQVKSYMFGILAYMYRAGILAFDSTSSIGKKRALLVKFNFLLKHIEENYEKDISLKDACGMMNLNYNYFCRLFKEATGKPFVQYVNFIRLAVAEKQLRTTDKPITEITYDSGFSSCSYFDRAFKRFNGYSPNAYRKKLRTTEDKPAV
jgi:AraC-like DNA-binding protein